MAAGIITVGAIIVISKVRLGLEKSDDVGMTSAIAILVMFCASACLMQGNMVVAVAIGVAVAALLLFKPDLHSIANKLGEKDMRAIIQFAIFSCVILPVLPNEQMGPLNVFNPFNIWLMVVLIVCRRAGWRCAWWCRLKHGNLGQLFQKKRMNREP